MKKVFYKMAAGLTAVGLAATVLAPAAFADNTISGNGSGSNNSITTTTVSNCTVSQSNVTNVGLTANLTSSTGGNDAKNNTGGDVTIGTGDASTSLGVSVSGGSNTANNPCCGCTQPLLVADGLNSNKVSGNGDKSKNTVLTTNVTTSAFSQSSQTTLSLIASLKAKTGKNKANSNTNGSTTIGTGTGTSVASVTVTGGGNSL